MRLDSNMGVGERAIRGAVRSWLLRTAEPEAFVRDELAVRSARVDLVRIGSLLEGFEIKSDFDNLDRLPRQVEACWRRSKSEPPCRPNIEPGVEAGLELTGCG